MIAELPTILREMGIDPAPCFQQIGVDVSTVTAETRLTIPEAARLLQLATEASGCEHIGLLCGMRFRLEHHGVIGELMRTAPTLWHALVDCVTWQPRYSSSAIVYLHRSGPDYAFGFGIYVDGTKEAAPIYDSILGVTIRMVRLLTERHVTPVEFLLSHRPPRDPAAYAQILRAPIRYNQPQSCLILSEETLRMPLPGANPEAHKNVQDRIRADGRWTGLDWRGRTRHEIRRSLLSANPHMDSVAGELGVTPRTLRRRLEDEATTFEALRDEVRAAAASELLELTDLPISEIGPALGFASSKVFSESFNRWTGLSPSAWRSRYRQRDTT